MADGHGKGGEDISQHAVNKFAELVKSKTEICTPLSKKASDIYKILGDDHPNQIKDD